MIPILEFIEGSVLIIVMPFKHPIIIPYLHMMGIIGYLPIAIHLILTTPVVS
jgi:hypothetical protein